MSNYFKSILFFVSIFISLKSTYSQEFDQLLVGEDLLAKYLSSFPGTERRLNSFGNFRYNLLLTCDNNHARVRNSQYEKNWIQNGINNKIFKLFTILDTKTGTIDFLNIDYNNYTPVSFLNNDTLVLKLNGENKFMGFCYSDCTYFYLNKNIEQLLYHVPLNDNYNFRFKINTSREKMILFNEKNLEQLKIYTFHQGDLIIKKIDSDVYFGDWKFLDFFWIDNDHILLFLAKPAESGIKYIQKIYNIQNGKIINLIINEKGYQVDDYYNGYCLVRTGKEPPAYIYKLDLINDSVALSFDSMIEVEQELSEPLYELGFVSERTIARITNIEGEKGFISLPLNLKSVNFLKFKITPIKPRLN